MKYEVYTIGGEKITSFESPWQFKDKEQIFVYFSGHKRNLVISHITHDVFDNSDKHVVRLYCQDRKVY